MFKIGYDAKRAFNNFTGLGNYSRTLIKSIADNYPDNKLFLFTPKVKDKPVVDHFKSSDQYQIIQPDKSMKAYWRTYGITKILKEKDLDIYHGLSNELPSNIQSARIKSIVTIHDLIFKIHPEHFPFIDRKIYEYKCQSACIKSDRIVAISKSAKQDIMKYYSTPEEKIDVIYQACGEQFKKELPSSELEMVKNKYKLPSEFLLFVGTINDRKNLKGLIKAIEALPEESKIPVVIVGSGKRYKKESIEMIRAKGLQKYFYFLRNVNDNDLAALYQLSNAFIYPSLYEGFGIPVIEALNSRTPVLASNTSSIPEAGGNAAEYFDPYSPEEIANAITKVLDSEDLQKEMISKGIEHAQIFSAEIAAQKIMNCYNSLMK
ncbi:glycosyltransferase family 4 protein [Marinigracilibium pacificum]|uniref:Glycosyltransferase family 4 protein n=1 Tax=Marinigracilibium pacificum TaxID=2729599 RepID=A0A848J496_9BACT|nr:glycosyltransferase family 1 protein [Marinigracilibium pacificum]NMM50561.1 glycosyltransferase family 4 protein [Marinigracilibium pacificum]